MDTVEVVRAWQAAWNARDAETLSRLTHDQIELVGPHGATRGRSVLRQMLNGQNSGVRIHVASEDFRVRGDVVVALGPLEFRDVDDGDRVARRQPDAGGAFTVKDGRITRFRSYENAEAALLGEGFVEHADAEEYDTFVG